ncbi:MAG: hypothetical protein ACE367_26995 [Acidimicrobiales bacterium]
MSGYDPQRRRRLTTRANTTAVEALLDGEPSRPRTPPAAADQRNPGLVPPDVRHESRISDEEPPALEARSGCLSALLTFGRR